MQPTKPLIVIVGPTASGKSDLAMKLALKYNGEIVCADSRTVYKGMDIGTAKPTQQDRAKVAHHLLDIVEPGEPFSAAKFKNLATAAIADIKRRAKLPLLVGGTGLYIDSVLFDYKFGEVADPKRRAELLDMTVTELQQLCRNTHIEMPINIKNKRHLVRAIELGGLPKRETQMIDDVFIVGITTNKEDLRKRVEQRAYNMLRAGILNEIRNITDRFGWENEAMTGDIYRVFRGVLQGTKTQEQAIGEVVQRDMALIKRQLTWFKRNPSIVWGTADGLEKRVDAYIRAASHFDTIGQKENVGSTI